MVKVLFYHDSEVCRDSVDRLFRNYFPMPADIKYADGSEDIPADLVAGVAFFSLSPFGDNDYVSFPKGFEESISDASILVFSPVNRIIDIPDGKRVMFYCDSSSSIEDLLTLLLPGMAGWFEFSNKADVLLMDRQLTDHLLNNSRSMLSVINREYVYERVNNQLCSVHSKECSDIEGRSLRDIWGEERFTERIKPHIDSSFSGKVVRYEADFNISSTSRRYYEVVFRPFHSIRGNVTHVIAETFDITELRDAETRFKALSSEFKRFETSIPVGFVRCAPDGQIIHMNRACLDIIGQSSLRSVHGKNIMDFYADKTLFGVHIDQLMRSESVSLGRIYLRSGTDKEVPCRIKGFKHIKPGSEQFYFDFAVEDISRELSLENRLMQAQRVESIGALAGGIAHDFNNLLTTIYGYAEMSLSDAEGSANHNENLKKIISTVARAKSLINQILTFSRQVEQEKIVVDVGEVLKEALGSVDSIAHANVTFEESISDSRMLVMADPTQLFRVFMNLLTNAIQAVGSEQGRITAGIDLIRGELLRDSVRTNVIAENYVVVSVCDTGSGIENSRIERIFEPFYTTREVGSGTGLGLSVAHGIVSELGGEIVVESKSGEGTRFQVLLPLLTSDEMPIHADFQGARDILFIGRDAHESRLLIMALKSAGYRIEFASSVTGVVRSLERESAEWDLIIFTDDIEEFSLDDLALLFGRLNITIPVILITDSHDLILEEKVLPSESVRHFLIRPVSLREIKSAIELSVNH